MCHVGDREVISNLATSWLELLIGMLLYGLPTKVATRHAVGPIIGQCLSAKADPDMPLAPGLFLTLMEELLPVRIAGLLEAVATNGCCVCGGKAGIEGVYSKGDGGIEGVCSKGDGGIEGVCSMGEGGGGGAGIEGVCLIWGGRD